MNYKLIEEKQKQIEDILNDLAYKEQNEVLYGVLNSFDFHTAANMVRSGKDIYMYGDILFENTYAGSNKKGCISLRGVINDWMAIVNTDKEYGNSRITEVLNPEKKEDQEVQPEDAVNMVKASINIDELFLEFEI